MTQPTKGLKNLTPTPYHDTDHQWKAKSQDAQKRSITLLTLSSDEAPASVENSAKTTSQVAAASVAFSPTAATAGVMPKASVAYKVTYTCEEAEKAVRASIAKLKTNLDYNGFHAVIAFINSLVTIKKSDNNISELEAFQKFQPDSRKEVDDRGGTCVGQSYAIVQTLEKDNVNVNGQPVKGYVITKALLGDDQPQSHAAAMIPCRDGVIIIELSWDDPLLVVKKHSGLTFVKGPHKEEFQIVKIPGGTYKLDKPIITHVHSMDGQFEYFEYLTDPANDPDNSVIKHWLLNCHDAYYPLTGAENGVTKSVIKFDLLRGEVAFQDQQNEKDPRVSIKFKDLRFDKNGMITNPEFHKFLETHEKFFTYFKTDIGLIFKQIKQMTENHESLQNLHIENQLKLLKEGLKNGEISPEILTRIGFLIRNLNPNETLKKYATWLNFTSQEVAAIKSKIRDIQRLWGVLNPLALPKPKVLEKFDEKTFITDEAEKFSSDQLKFIKKHNLLSRFDKESLYVIRSLSSSQLAIVDKYDIVDRKFSPAQISILEKLSESDLHLVVNSRDVWNQSTLSQLDALFT